MPRPWLNKIDFVQVNAFKSIFRQNLRMGHSIDESFAGAIESTSDKVFKKANPELIKEYVQKYGDKKTTHRIKNQPVYVGD